MPATDPAAFVCPHCHVPLTMSERQGIEIDYCPQCRGVWLDRGELDKIIERGTRDSAPAAPQPPQAHAPQYGQPHHDQRYPKHRKPKHWLSEIFD